MGDELKSHGSPVLGQRTQGSRVLSAARTKPLREEKPPLAQRLKSWVADLALNSLSIAKEQWESFCRADIYFKWRAGIVGSWALLTCLTLVVVCPSSELDAKNSLGARLVLAGDATEPIYMLVNDGAEAWTSARVVVNGGYQMSVARVEPRGNITFIPKQLTGAPGVPPPANFQVSDLELQTSHGKARLMKHGRSL